MDRDDSHLEVIQKFSFIESLSLSKEKSRADRVHNSRRASFSHSDSSIVATAEPATAIDSNRYSSETDAYRLTLAELVRTASTEAASVPVGDNFTAKRNYLGKILFALSCSYCLFVLWWVFGHQGNRLLTVLSGGRQVVLSKSDVQFIDYMERSLAKIDRQRAEVEQDNEVVYVPVYTPTPAPSQPQIPPVSSPQAITPEAIKIPAPPPLPAPTPITDSSAKASQAAIAIIT